MGSIFDSSSELLKLLELAQCCIKAGSDKDEVDHLVDLVKGIIPCSSLVIGLDDFAPFGARASRQLLNYGYSAEWIELYLQNAFQEQDPVLWAARNEAGAFSWASAYARGPKPSQAFVDLSRAFVGSNGIACRVSSRSHTSSTLISMVLPDHVRAEEHLATLEYLAPHLHELFSRPGSLNRQGLSAPEISRRELQVLHWAKEGKGTWEISHILSISERTVKFHFANVFRKLDVLNRSQAVAKALHLGVLSF